jgi:hypothetical protein
MSGRVNGKVCDDSVPVTNFGMSSREGAKKLSDSSPQQPHRIHRFLPPLSLSRVLGLLASNLRFKTESILFKCDTQTLQQVETGLKAQGQD